MSRDYVEDHHINEYLDRIAGALEQIAAPRLDVERLHEALRTVLNGTYGTQWAEDERAEVEQIAAEYARLAGES